MFAYVGRQSVCVPRCSYVFRFAATYLLCITLNPQVLGSSPRGRTRSEGIAALQLLARSEILGPSAKQSLLRKRTDRGTCSFSSREQEEGFFWLPCSCRSCRHLQRRRRLKGARVLRYHPLGSMAEIGIEQVPCEVLHPKCASVAKVKERP